ncbi:MAG: VOC family protein [Rhizobacter sp.]
MIRRALLLLGVCLTLLATAGAYLRADEPLLQVTAVQSVGFTVSDMERSVAFYTDVLGFERVSDHEFSGREHELATGVFGARIRVVGLRLGGQSLELTQYLAPVGRPAPDDLRAHDAVFQHVAIVVSDMDRAYAQLRAKGVRHASTGPQRLPDWNPNAGGISAFYFRDPDGHFLEILHFPPDKGQAMWHRPTPLLLGIDHTAIVVDDTDRALRFYRDVLGLAIAGTSENYDLEQEHLNNVFGARLRITTLRAAAGPGIELLEYLAPRDGRPAPRDLRANDLAHWQTTVVTNAPERVFSSLATRAFALVSPRPADIDVRALDLRQVALIRDADGHGVRVASTFEHR